jgi:hypothetical protein
VEALKVGRWFSLILLLGFILFDLCGKPASVPLPPESEVAAHAAARGARPVTFDELASFPCPWPESFEDPPPGGGPATGDAPRWTPPVVPEEIRALDGSRVTLAGYVLPTEMEGGRVLGGLFCRYAAGCCYGGQPQANELVELRIADPRGFEAETHLPVLLTGTLRVRSVGSPKELLNGIYVLEDAVAE